MLPEFELLIPQTLEEAISILSEKGKDCTVVPRTVRVPVALLSTS